MFLECIEGLPLVFERLKVSIAEMQQLVLELQAFIDYVSVYQPRMIGASPRPPEDGQLAVRHLVGVFTMNHTMAQECFRAGIPIWLIYPLTSAPTVCINALDEIQEPVPPFIVLSKSRLRVRPVYIGLATDDDKYKAIETYTHSHLTMANLFLSSASVQAPSTLVPAKPSSMREHYEPYKRSNLSRQGKEKPSNKVSWVKAMFEVMTHSHLAPLINTWKLGLQQVNATKERPPCHAMGFTLPCPELFIMVQTDAKFQLMITFYQPQLHSHQTWRTILQIDWLEQSQGFSSSSRARGEQVRRDQVAAFLEGCQGELTVKASVSDQRAQWRDKDSSSLSLEDIRKILWELAEVNFCTEFQVLDRKLCGNESIRHQMLIGQCFPNGKANMLHRVPLGSANYGLTHSNWLEHAPYIFTMCRCMQQWNNCPSSLSPSSNQKGGYSESEVEVIEQEMAYFYAESFFMNFGQEPIFPCNLTHTPDVTYVPERRERAQAARPGFYLDILQWEGS
ncbi:hypothetical protein EDD18DRAFT_1358443 [Armillaria luteobubalina]|uniref:Uncharacterized protein n=1 Tax=Armillaria luteobubalina TaxID=153913 RepID=A0AA39PYF9_9AGAR|nr:hypothetical protein EDD18DRAFT_1358443 [Armillaria luteobubalina]